MNKLLIKENNNIRHKKVTYNDNNEVLKTEIEYYPKELYIQGPFKGTKMNSNMFIPPMNNNKKLYPSNKSINIDDTPSQDMFKNNINENNNNVKYGKWIIEPELTGYGKNNGTEYLAKHDNYDCDHGQDGYENCYPPVLQGKTIEDVKKEIDEWEYENNDYSKNLNLNESKKIVRIKESKLVDMLDNIVAEAIIKEKKKWLDEQTKKGQPITENKIKSLLRKIIK